MIGKKYRKKPTEVTVWEYPDTMTGQFDLASELRKYGADVDMYYAAKDLLVAGLLAPDLPKPMQDCEAERTGGTPGSRWYGYEDDGNDDGSEMYSPHRYVDAYPGEVWIDWHVCLSPEGAKEYALAILAATKLAEEQTDE